MADVSKEKVQSTVERRVHCRSGWSVLLGVVVLLIVSILCLVGAGVIDGRGFPAVLTGLLATFGCLLIVAAFLVSCGFMCIQPNTARVLVLFGEYKGTVSDEGFRWVNPFYSK